VARFEVVPPPLISVPPIRPAFLVVLHGGIAEPDNPFLIPHLGSDDELLPALNITYGTVRNQLANLVTVTVH
jgi:hypothetical protein